jgi:hypothetical protein
MKRKKLAGLILLPLLGAVGLVAGIGTGAGATQPGEFWLHCKDVRIVCSEESPPTVTVTATITETTTTTTGKTGTTATPTSTPTRTPTSLPTPTRTPTSLPTPTGTPKPTPATPLPSPSSSPCSSSAWPSGSLLPARLAASTGGVISVSSSTALRSALSSVNPGETIRIAEGPYGAGETLYAVTRSGTASAPITIEGSGGTVLDTSLQMSASYVRIRNLEIDGTTRSDENGIYGPSGSNVELCGLYIHDVTRGGKYAQGIITSSSTANWQIINVRIERIGNPTAATLNEWEHGLYLNGTGYLVANVLIKDASGFGAQLYPNLDNSILTHITFVGSKTKSGLINASGSTGNRVYNSISEWNASTGYEGPIAGDHLIAYGNAGGVYSIASCSACLAADPLLDFSLRPQPGSPAIGYSDPRYSPQFDLSGRARPAAPAAGAYEP